MFDDLDGLLDPKFGGRIRSIPAGEMFFWSGSNSFCHLKITAISNSFALSCSNTSVEQAAKIAALLDKIKSGSLTVSAAKEIILDAKPQTTDTTLAVCVGNPVPWNNKVIKI